MELEFVFGDQVEIFIFDSYKFVMDDEEDYLVPQEKIEAFRERLNEDGTNGLLNGKQAKFDSRNTHYGYAESFSEENEKSKEKLPLVVPLSVEEVADLINEEKDQRVTPVSDTASESEDNRTLANAHIRLTQHGIASIRFHYKVDMDKYSIDTGKVDALANYERECKDASEELGEKIWDSLVEAWNETSDVTLATDDKSYLDRYTAVFSKDIDIKQGHRADLPLTTIKTGTDKLSEENEEKVKRQLTGIGFLSTNWPFYSSDFVDEYIESDLAVTETEFQFMDWDSAFFMFYVDTQDEEKWEELHDNYRNYLNDMLLGIELLFIIRSSLRLLESLIDELSDDHINTSYVQNPFRLKSYYKQLDKLDRWLTSINDWRTIYRYAQISHLHEFLSSGLNEMRIDSWLDTIENRLGHLRDIYRVRSTKLETINQILLTTVSVLLALSLVLIAIF